MNKKNLRPLILSSLTALAMAGVGTGATFALFTDKAETTIQVEAGKVDVSTSISDLEFFELGRAEKITATDAEGALVNSIGGTVKVEDNALVLNKWAPGDKVTFKLTNKNLSNVAIKTRFVEKNTHTGTDLYPALKVNYTAVNGENQDISHRFQDWQRIDPVADPATPETISVVSVTIEFPNADNEITSRDTGINNAYQGADTRIVFAQEAVQGNAAVRTMLEEINAVLGASSQNNATMSAAFAELGAHDSTWNPNLFKRNHFVWASTSDSVFYQEDVPAGQEYHYFKVYDEMPAAEPYSIYANGWTTTPTVSLTGLGFDAGTSSGITEISYIGGTEARENYILSNSLSTNITINAPLDVVHHYGEAGSVNIVAVAGSSYHEHGRVAFGEIANGRLVLEEDAQMGQIHLKYDANEGKFDNIVVALPENATLPTFSRDGVDEIPNSGLLVVTVERGETASDFIWLYQQGLKEQIRVSQSGDAAGDVVSTDASVDSNTAQIAEDISNVLADSTKNYADVRNEDGSVSVDTREKGLSEEQKASAKEEKVNEVVDESFVDPETNYCARIGDVGYTNIKDAFAALKTGETLRLLTNITINQSDIEETETTQGTRDSAFGNLIEGKTFDGGNHSITFADGVKAYLFGNMNGVIKNFKLYNATQAMVRVSRLEHRAASTIVYENIEVHGSIAADGNVGALVVYLDGFDGKFQFKDCVVDVEMTGAGTRADYNAAFIGYLISTYEANVELIRCVNKGSIVCGAGAFAIANPNVPQIGHPAKVKIIDCRNEGIIQRTYVGQDAFAPSAIYGATVPSYDVTTTVDGNEPFGMQDIVAGNVSNWIIPGNPLVIGPVGTTLALSKNADGTFTAIGMEGAAKYEISVGLYVGVIQGGGSNRYYAKEAIIPEDEGPYASHLKDLEFVDQDWVNAHEGATVEHPSWNEELSIVSYQDKQYFLIPDAYELDGVARPGEMYTLSAYRDNGSLLASVSL